ncbi:prolyl oligopeptidase [Salix suchowensis]|nr:prolyl oligopeptidase [Salix suchowensis]
MTQEGSRKKYDSSNSRLSSGRMTRKGSSTMFVAADLRYPDRQSHGLATDDTAGTETEGDVNAMLCYHRIDTPQSEDILVHKDDTNPEWMWSVDVSDQDGRYLTMYVVKDTSRKNLAWVTDLQKNEIGPNMMWDKIVDEFEAEYEVPQTGAPGVDSRGQGANLVSIKPVNHNKLVVVYKRNVKDEVYIYSNDGKRVTRVAEDFVGATTISARKKHSWFFVSMVGFNTPNTVGRYVFDEENEGKRWNIYRTTP